MAIATRINYTYRDRKGKISTTEVKVPSGTSILDLGLFATEMAQLIDPLLRGALVGMSATISFGLPVGVTMTPFDDADVEEKVYAQFLTADGWTKISLPTAEESKCFLPNGDLDTADADVAAWITAMESGIDLTGVGGSGIIQPTDSRDTDIEAFDYGYELFRNSGKR